MRLSGLVIAACLLLISSTVQAQHSFGGGTASANGAIASLAVSHASGGGSSSGSSSAASAAAPSTSHGSSGSSATSGHSGSASTHSTAGHSNGGAPSNSGAKNHVSESPAATKTDAKPENKGFFSFLRHRKPAPAPEPAIISPLACKIGQNCTRTCTAGKTWNGFGCGLPFQYAQYRPYWRLNDCSALAQELQALRAQMAGQTNPGNSARYRSLLSQYEACMQRSRFGSLAFDHSLLANPFLD